MMKRFLFLVSVLAFCMPTFVINTNAAGAIPRTDLRLELLLATGSADTSGNNRIVSNTGAMPTYEVDSMYGVPYAKFDGNSGLKLNTGWSTSVDTFTVSFWMRHPNTFLTGATSVTGATQEIYTYQMYYGSQVFVSNHFDTYVSDLAQNIFTSGENSELKFVVNSSGKCAIRGGTGMVQTLNQSIGTKYNSIGWLITMYKYNYKVFDVGNNLQENFNCSSLLDNKWHNVILVSQTGSTSVYIDGAEVVKLSGRTSIGKNISIGSSDTNVLTYSGKGIDTTQISTIAGSKFLRGNISAFRLYSRALTELERDAVFEEFRYAQSDLSGAGDIGVSMERYAKPNLYLQFKNIPLTLSKENVNYEYTTDGQNFTPIANITDISTSTGVIDYRIAVDLSNKPDGRITVTFRVRGTESFQNIGVVSFNKMDADGVITVNMPPSTIESAKTITASAPTATLSMYTTTTTVCDATISASLFEEYYDITFTNPNDNGKRVCYKAFYPAANKTIYKLSGIIQGIQPTDNIIALPTSSLFGNYTLWAKSLYTKASDSASMILELLTTRQRTDSYASNTAFQGYSISAGNVLTLTDINGDGLVDFLYSTTDPVRRAIIVNNGNFTFKIAYKCAVDGTSPNYTYYGDCADTTR